MHPLHTVCRFFRRKKTKGRCVQSQETVAHVPPRITRARVAFCSSPPSFHPPINHPVTDGFCRKFGNPGDCSPSGFLYAFSIIFLFFLYLFSAPRPPFHGLKKSTQLPSTRHMVLCRFFFRVVHHPASPYFPPLDSGPFCTFAGPCPASGNVRIFFFSSFFDLVQSRPRRGVVDAEKKFIENLPNRREAGHNAPPWKCWTFRWFSDVKRRREW